MVRDNHGIASGLIEWIFIELCKNEYTLTLGCMHILSECFSFVLKIMYDTKYIKDLLKELPQSAGDLRIQVF